MAASSGNCVVLFLSIAFAMFGGINCMHSSASAMTYAIPEIYSLLENITGTANEAVNVFENQLVKQQENHKQTMALSQNQLIKQQENHEQAMVLYRNQLEKQDQLLNVLQCQQDNNTGIINVLQNIVNQVTTSQQEKENQVINYLLQGQQNSLKIEQDHHQEVATLLQNQQQTLTQIAESQAQMVMTQSQMAVTQSQMAVTQGQMAITFNQVVSLLQMQNQQLQYVTDTMNTMVSVMENQQETTLIAAYPTMMTSTEHVTQDTTTNVEFPIQDCSELVTNGHNPSSIYTITPSNGASFDVYCDMDTAGGGWTVFQKRFNGSINFYRGWDKYKQGFGDINGEFWLGLRILHQLTQSGTWVLRVDLEDFNGETAYALYNSFQIGEAASNYRLSIGSYSGTAGDSLSLHNNMQFSTYDRDNDVSAAFCADDRQGAWWYSYCGDSNLNGRYLGPSRKHWTGMTWNHWKSNRSLKKSEMKIRRVVK